MELDPKRLPTPQEAIDAYMLNPDTESLPLLMFSGERGMILAVLAGFGPGQMQTAVRRLLPDMIKERGPANWVVLCAESWAKTFPKHEELRAGALQAAHEAGDPEVIEVVMVNGFSKDGEFSAQRAFERKDGQIVWGELEVMPETAVLQGGIPDAIRPVFA